MPRMRTIRPGFFSNELLGELPPLARILFLGLWCWADREGRLEDRPKRLKTQILPYDDCDVDNLLITLSSGDDPFIIRYDFDKRKYIQILNFDVHQKIHPNEIESEIPPPEGFTDNRDKSRQIAANNYLGITKNSFPSLPSYNLRGEEESPPQTSCGGITIKQWNMVGDMAKEKGLDLISVLAKLDIKADKATNTDITKIKTYLKNLPEYVPRQKRTDPIFDEDGFTIGERLV
jgi:hypothetical protein